MVRINMHGIIKGGVCDKRHHSRAARERGARLFLNELIKRKCIESNNGWLKIVKLPIIPKRKISAIGAAYGGDSEVGYRRFRSDVVEQLYHKKHIFRMNWLEKWLEGICSFEFAAKADNPLSILEGKCEFGYAPPHQDALYKKRKELGEFSRYELQVKKLR